MTQQQLYSVKDTREILGGISRATFYRLLDEGSLTKIKLGSRTFVSSTNIGEYLEELGA
jgi:excisionase family DNA binding protein